MPVLGERLEKLSGPLVHANFPRKGYEPMIGPSELPPTLVWTNGAQSSLKVSVLTSIGPYSALPWFSPSFRLRNFNLRILKFRSPKKMQLHTPSHSIPPPDSLLSLLPLLFKQGQKTLKELKIVVVGGSVLRFFFARLVVFNRFDPRTESTWERSLF